MKTAASLWFALLLFGMTLIEPASAGEAAYRLSERTWKQLSRVHEAMQKKRYDEALSRLDSTHQRVKHKAHEHALVLQTYGYLYTDMQQYQQAVDALKRCLALDALPDPATRDTLYLLVQLQTSIADYPAAVVNLEQWFRLQQNPAPDAHALAGTIYAQLKRYDRAATHLYKAITLAEYPQEQWYRQLLAVYYDARQYSSAADLLQQMIIRFANNRDYWLQLSSVYRELGDDVQSLAVMQLAYLQGVLDREPDLINLARYYLYMELPHRAGELLEDNLQQGTLKATPDNWHLATDAWLQAKETDRALTAAERALAIAPDADLQLKRTQLLMDMERWRDVINSADAALADSELVASGRAYLLRGIAHYNLQQLAEAQASFQRASDFNDSRNQAEQWIRYLDGNRQVASEGHTTAHLSH